jgi:hypothetical protein
MYIAYRVRFSILFFPLENRYQVCSIFRPEADDGEGDEGDEGENDEHDAEMD